MTNLFKRMSAGLLALCVVLSLVFAGLPQDVFAASITYSTSYNSGTRDEICTTLDGTGASDYYTSSYTFDTLSQQSSSQLLQSLRTLMTSTHKKITSYDNCRDYANRTDCQDGDGRVLLLYTSYSATMSQYNGWNREHVWPKSLGGNNTSGGGADLHHIRPSDAGVNSSRGNKKYGESNNGTAKYGSNPATGYLGGTYNSTYFEPVDNVKGDVARICLYVYVRWGSAWGADSITEVFQSVDILLEWMEIDPVDTWEMGRNEVVEDIQGNRNVFIDYPEYAWLLFGRDVPEGITTPSDNDGVSANPGSNNNNNNNNNNTGTTDTSYTQISSLKDGDKVVIVNPASKMALSMVKTGYYYNTGVDVSSGFGSITNDEIFTVKKNSDGTYTFTSVSGKVVALADANQSLNDAGTHNKWEVVSAGGSNFYLKNATRNAEYLEWYASKGNWSTYHPSSLNTDYVLAFYVKSSSSSTTQPTTPATQPTTSATQPTTPETQPTTPATQPTTSNTPEPMPTNPVTPPVAAEPSSTGVANWLSAILGGGIIGMIVAALVAIVAIVALIGLIVVIIIIVKKKRKNAD